MGREIWNAPPGWRLITRNGEVRNVVAFHTAGGADGSGTPILDRSSCSQAATRSTAPHRPPAG